MSLLPNLSPHEHVALALLLIIVVTRAEDQPSSLAEARAAFAKAYRKSEWPWEDLRGPKAGSC
jgi:hypothetical protein